MKEHAANWNAWGRRLRAVLSDEKKRVNLLLCMGLAGLLLLALSEWLPEPAAGTAAKVSPPVQTRQDYAAQLEARLQELIVQVDGVGRAEVMVTLAQGEENIYATDSETAGDGASSVSHVLTGDDGLVETVRLPRVLGVAVVCDGGERAAVQNRICALVDSLTGVGANHITVAKMAPSE